MLMLQLIFRNNNFAYYHRKSSKLVGMDTIHHEHYHFKDESKPIAVASAAVFYLFN
ncbi:hypothetical protein MKY19_17870 [Paenibacillus sp. FSL R5-0744]|uniref:hypothetical protein n=1 Tax=Paenibacillus sp. FSL R5-0744 TaxID=2921656 RepID=UPI0030DCAFEE